MSTGYELQLNLKYWHYTKFTVLIVFRAEDYARPSSKQGK